MPSSPAPAPAGEYWDSLAYQMDGTPAHNQDAHRQRIVNWINAAGGLSTAFDITTKGILHAGGCRAAGSRQQSQTCGSLGGDCVGICSCQHPATSLPPLP